MPIPQLCGSRFALVRCLDDISARASLRAAKRDDMFVRRTPPVRRRFAASTPITGIAPLPHDLCSYAISLLSPSYQYCYYWRVSPTGASKILTIVGRSRTSLIARTWSCKSQVFKIQWQVQSQVFRGPLQRPNDGPVSGNSNIALLMNGGTITIRGKIP